MLIPNFNDLACCIDRISIAEATKATFEDKKEGCVDDAELMEISNKIKLQDITKELLKEEFKRILNDVCKRQRYEYLKEHRTFI